MQYLLVPVAQARKAINRKRFLEEYERTVNNFTGRMVLNSNETFAPGQYNKKGALFQFLFARAL